MAVVESRPPPPATLAALEALPPHIKGEIIDGVLYTQARPRIRHQNVIASILDDVRSPYHRGRNGPGGWWIVSEPGIELPRAEEVSPDVAGWRRTTMPHFPPPGDPVRAVPDWVCEILSPGTRRTDLRVKRPFYADIGVRHLWLVDIEERMLTVLRLHDGKWLEVEMYGEEDQVHAEPFEQIRLDLAAWWEG